MSETVYRVRLLMLVRVVAVTALLIAAFLVELWFHPIRSLRPLYVLTAATYALTIVYGLLYAALQERRSFIYLQLVGDILTSTGFVYITGSVSSPFSFLYVPVIIAGGMLLFRRGAYTVAALSCVAYGTLVALVITGPASRFWFISSASPWWASSPPDWPRACAGRVRSWARRAKTWRICRPSTRSSSIPSTRGS
jgi:hypothetical protein